MLDQRQLEGVIAHELSHVGNYDTRLTTMLAALVGIACAPIRACEAGIGLFYDNSVRDYGHLVTRLVPQLPLPFLTIDPRFVVAEDLTAVYEQPDGWSRVLTQLTKNTVVTAVGREENFVRVITKDNVAGYVANSAGLPGPNK